MATNPYVNKVSYNNGTLIDISDTTATADKVQNGYKIYGADGAPVYGTATQGVGITTTDTTDPVSGGTFREISGQTIQPYDPRGQYATLVKTVNLTDMKLSETSFSSTATAAANIKAYASTGQTYAANMGTYDYLIRNYLKVTYAYTEGATLKAMPLYFAHVQDYVVSRGFSNHAYKIISNYNYNQIIATGNTPMLEGYNSSGSRTYVNGSYGVYLYDTSMAFSNRYNDSITLTLYSPRLYFSANNSTWLTAATRSAIDAENTQIKWWIELYQMTKGTSYLLNRYKTAVDLNNAMLPTT